MHTWICSHPSSLPGIHLDLPLQWGRTVITSNTRRACVLWSRTQNNQIPHTIPAAAHKPISFPGRTASGDRMLGALHLSHSRCRFFSVLPEQERKQWAHVERLGQKPELLLRSAGWLTVQVHNWCNMEQAEFQSWCQCTTNIGYNKRQDVQPPWIHPSLIPKNGLKGTQEDYQK